MAEATTDASPIGRRFDTTTAGQHHERTRADESPQVGPRTLRPLPQADEARNIGVEPPSEAGPLREPRMRGVQRRPHEVVEDLHLFVRQVDGVMFGGGHRGLRLGKGWLMDG